MISGRKLRSWVLISFSSIWAIVMSGCTSDMFYDGVRQFDIEAAERHVIFHSGQAVDGSPMPSPIYSPEDVVQIQLDALQNNNAADDGIAIVFRFASPRNKRMTGPLRRFAGVIKSPAYRPMLGHQSTLLEAVEIDGREASQRVRLIDQQGNEIIYLFVLTKQSEETCGGCWMTDIVVIEAISPVPSA